MSFASVCILSYNRPEFVQQAIRTARDNAGYPLELVVHDDGSDVHTQNMLHGMLQAGEISTLLMNPPGQNQGVGEAVRKSFAAAQGDILVKVDQDLIFERGWLARGIEMLSMEVPGGNGTVGMAGFFHYYHDPVDTNKMRLAELIGGVQIHEDFCSSAFIIHRDVFEHQEWETHSDAFAEDVGLKTALRKAGFSLVLPPADLCTNRGFGIGPSTVAVMRDGKPAPAFIKHEPVIFGRPSENADEQPPSENADERPHEFKVGVVITTIAGREQNLQRVLAALDEQTLPLTHVVIVWDGCEAQQIGHHKYAIRHVQIAKHRPGMEQPRNVGVRQLLAVMPDATYAWFIDSDIVMPPHVLQEYADAHAEHNGEDAIMYGPYDSPGGGAAGVKDVRWEMFNSYGREHIHRGKGALGVALGCFGGNIMYPIADFMRVGGFHPDLHHGRCEDGELGLRALSLGCGVAIVRGAGGMHLMHPVDMASAIQKNARDVPLLNKWHPWVKEQGLIVTEEEGARFEYVCPKCKEQMNCHLWWSHTC